MLAGEDHRHAQLQAGHDGRRNAGGFDGDDLGDAGIAEQAGEFLPDGLHQHGIDLVVEERVDLEYPVGKHDALTANLIFQLFHERYLKRGRPRLA